MSESDLPGVSEVPVSAQPVARRPWIAPQITLETTDHTELRNINPFEESMGIPNVS